METLIGKGTHGRTTELEALISSGMFYFQQAVDLYGETGNLDVSSLLRRRLLAGSGNQRDITT